MKMRNEITGNTIELPPPDHLGQSTVLFNGKVVETCLYSDVTDTVTTGDGRIFTAGEWPKYIVEQLRTGAYLPKE